MHEKYYFILDSHSELMHYISRYFIHTKEMTENRTKGLSI